jgi:hypothetical protein
MFCCSAAGVAGVWQHVHMPTVLRELTALTLLDKHGPRTNPELGRLPVFITQLGAAVKEDWERYPLYDRYHPVRLEYDVHEFVWRPERAPTQQQLEQYLVGGAGQGVCIQGDGTMSV